jgi:hypothetical protein
MKKHLFVVLALAAVAGVGLFALAADQTTENRDPPPNSKIAADEPKGNSGEGTSQPSSGGGGSAAASNSDAEFNEPSRSPAEMYARMDPAFSKYVDLSLLAQAMAGPDASLLTDVALAIAEGERILVRNHRSGLNSEDLMARAVKLAARTGDKETLDRVSKAAAVANKPQWAKLVTENKEFAGVSRDGPMIHVGKIDTDTIDLTQAVKHASDSAHIVGNREDLEHLKKVVNQSNADDKVKAYLLGLLEIGIKVIPDKSNDTDDLLREFAAASREDSNRNEVRENLERGGYSVIWGKNFTEGDWIEGTKAIAESVAAENPGPFLRWFGQVLQDNFTKIERNLPGVARRDIERLILESLRNKRFVTIRGLHIEAGFATYNRWKRVVYDEPRTGQRKVRLYPGGPWTYVPYAYTERVEKKIPLPNWHQFYIRYKINTDQIPGPGPRPGPAPEHKVWIYNQTNNPINYQITAAGGGMENFTLQPGWNRWHSIRSNDPRFVIRYDFNFDGGFQERRYNLTPNSHNDFKVVGDVLDLYRR